MEHGGLGNHMVFLYIAFLEQLHYLVVDMEWLFAFIIQRHFYANARPITGPAPLASGEHIAGLSLHT